MTNNNNKEIITVTFSFLPETPQETADFESLPLCELLDIDETCPTKKERKLDALRRRRHLIIANYQKGLQLLQPGLHSEHDLLKFVGEEKEIEAKKDGFSTLFPKFKALIDRLGHHAVYIGSRHPLQTATLERLAELLPNLTLFQLVQQHGSPQELGRVAQLLDAYRHQLEEVVIVFRGELGERSRWVVQFCFQANFTELMDSLNRMTKLRSLKVDFQVTPGSSVVIADDQLVQHSLPDLVGRLETLKFCICLNELTNRVADVRLLKQVLQGMRDGGGGNVDKTVASKQENSFKLYFPGTPLTLRTLISLGPGPAAAGLRSINIDGRFSADSKAEYKALARLARQSPHLQALTVNLKSGSIWRLVESLSTLKELVHLNIRCFSVGRPPQEAAAAVNAGQLPVLPSVKSLELSFSTHSHLHYKQLHLETFFPRLQVIQWIHLGWDCTACGYEVPEEVLFTKKGKIDAAQFKAAYGGKMSECLRLARLTAFSRLPQMTSLYMHARPFNLNLPFKNQQFASQKSLHRRTEFIGLNVKDPSQTFVVYK